MDRRQALDGIAALTGALSARALRAQTPATVNMGKLELTPSAVQTNGRVDNANRQLGPYHPR